MVYYKERNMCEIISFIEAKRNIKNQKIFDEYVSGNINQYLIDGYRYLDIARHRERQINDLDNRIYLIENKMRELKEAKQQDELKAVTAFVNAFNRGCAQAGQELQKHFPETYRQLEQQKKEQLK